MCECQAEKNKIYPKGTGTVTIIDYNRCKILYGLLQQSDQYKYVSWDCYRLVCAFTHDKYCKTVF